MKNIFLVFVFLICFLFSGCSKENISPADILPTTLISELEAEKAVGEEIDLSLRNNAVEDLGNNTYRAFYSKAPIGSSDPVIVEITYPSEELPNSKIKSSYNNAYKSRLNKRKIKGIGAEAFVAFPTINIYEKGFYIRITAGSGDTQKQLDTLISLGKTAVLNLNRVLENK